MSRIFPLSLAAAAFAAPLAFSAPASAAGPALCTGYPPSPSCLTVMRLQCLNGVIGTGVSCEELSQVAPPHLGSVGVLAPGFERATPRSLNPADWRMLNPQPIPPAPAFR